MARLLIFACGWFALTTLSATAAPAFDPDAATRAWIGTMGPQAIARSNAYFEGGYLIQFVGAGLSIAISMALMMFGWAKGVRTWLERRVKWFFLVALGMAFFYSLVAQVLTFPFDLYVGYFRQHEYNLLNQNFGSWFGDYAINAAIDLPLTAFFIAIIYIIVRAAKDTWWIWASAVAIFFLAVQVALAPVYIAPLFNKFTELPDGPVRHEVVAMAEANGVPAEHIYTYNRSRQSNSITAYVSGLFGTTRIVLADTLTQRCDLGCTRAVMGHELGHYVLRHITSLLLMIGAMIVVMFALLHVSFKRGIRGERWGVREIWDPAGLPLAIALLTIFGLIATPLQNNIIRFHERQADYFGLNLAREPDGFAEASLLLSEYRKMEPSPLEEWFFYDHPSGYGRIHMAMVWKANEIAAGRLPPSPGGPPPGWRPDFVVMHEQQPASH
ncbi:MAG: M48 family metallopeptidase [Pseudomonadota bacterium]